MYSKGFCCIGEMIFKCGRQNGRQKQGFLSKNQVFDCIKLSNMQKNRVFMLPNSHKYLILVRSTGIEDMRRYEKSLENQGFFAIERQRGRQKKFKISFPVNSYMHSRVWLSIDYSR